MKPTSLILFYIFSTCLSLRTINLGKKKWIVSNANRSILVPVKVPGGIYSDLINANVLKEYVYHKGNDINYRWVGKTMWIYSTTFPMKAANLMHKSINITFEGVDTVALVYLNKKLVGKCDNMFIRYSFDIKHAIQTGKNSLEVHFLPPIEEAKRRSKNIPYKIVPECPPSSYHGECHINQLRKMQASFSWDWGPAFPSVGIWKPVYIELNEGKLLRSVGTFITESPMNWRVTIRFWFDGDYQVTGDLSAKLDIMPGVSYTIQKFNVSVGTEERLVLSVPKNQVKVWWPNSLGKQPLYKLKANFTSNGATITKSIKIAFRTVELSQEPVSMDLSKGEVFYFKVNGVPIFAKGSNWIPSHVLPENLENKKKIYSLLKSSVDANFNMLRVWGGGIYESDYFYSVCDQLGIMIWQDLMFACSMYPSTDDFLNSVKTEVKQNMQRLQHHVSIVLIAGNNENEAALRQDWYGTGSSFKKYKDDYITLYVDSIKPIIEQINPQVTYLTSSPSNGLETEREGYVARNPQNNLYGDVHFYNYYTNLWLADVFPHPRFSSEYGLQSLPAMSTLKKVFDKEDLMWGSNALNERQHLPVGNDILQLQIDQNLPKAFNLSDVIYLSQINQAMAMKTETELYRSLRSVLEPTGAGLTMGALYWQLNDIWEAPSWSSIDFYGNWKMLHYYTRDFFSNVIISPARTAADNLVVSVVSDLTHQLNGTLKIYVYNWDAFEPKNIIKMPIQIDGGMSVKVLDKFLLDILGDYDNFSNSFLIFKMDVIPFVSVPDNFLFPVPPKNSNFPDATVTIKSIYKTTDNTAEITLQTDKIALFVWLESTDEKVNFHFSKNGFHMLLPETVITVMSMEAQIEEEALFEQISVRNLKPTYS